MIGLKIEEPYVSRVGWCVPFHGGHANIAGGRAEKRGGAGELSRLETWLGMPYHMEGDKEGEEKSVWDLMLDGVKDYPRHSTDTWSLRDKRFELRASPLGSMGLLYITAFEEAEPPFAFEFIVHKQVNTSAKVRMGSDSVTPRPWKALRNLAEHNAVKEAQKDDFDGFGEEHIHYEVERVDT